MVDFKLIISDPKSGKTVQKEVKDKDASFFLHKKVGEKIVGEDFGFSGYEFVVTGGSDYCGFPMRKGVPGIKRKKILTFKSIGFRGKTKGRTKKKKKDKPKRKGLRRKKTVCGEIVHDKISQINLKILKIGKENLFEEGKTEEEKTEKAEVKKEAKAEVKKESKAEAKKEAKAEAKKEAKEPEKK